MEMLSMNVQCPKCEARGKISDSRIPPDGLEIGCPQCGNRFPVRGSLPADDTLFQEPDHHEQTVASSETPENMIVCRRCGAEQPNSNLCALCGGSMKGEQTARGEDIIEASTVEPWYQAYLDGRLTTRQAQILSLLVAICMLSSISIMLAMREKAPKPKQAIVSEPSGRTADQDRLILAHLYTLENKLASSSKTGLEQCNLYLNAWYGAPRVVPPHTLTEKMTEGLQKVLADKKVIDEMRVHFIAPSEKYLPYYLELRRLNYAYDKVYRLAADHKSNYGLYVEGWIEPASQAMEKALDALNMVRPLELADTQPSSR